MKPILISTPRSGSTIVAEKIFNISRDNFNYIDNLDEFFNVTDMIQTNYHFVENKIVKEKSQKIFKKWYNDKQEIYQYRLNLLKYNPNYLIKFFPFNTPKDIETFIIDTYDLIFLERKNKVAQFISFLGLFCEKKYSHNTINNFYQITKLKYDKKLLDSFINIIHQYNAFKEKKSGITIFYEDVLQNKINETNIATLLNLNIHNINNYENKIIKTSYITDPELLIENYDEWKQDKHRLFNL